MCCESCRTLTELDGLNSPSDARTAGPLPSRLASNGGKGRNTIKGGELLTQSWCNVNDSLVGDKGNDRINSQRHDDTVDGGAGDDFIVMGDNFDDLTSMAGAGTDTRPFSFTNKTPSQSSILDN